MSNRRITHYVGDSCPGGHRTLTPGERSILATVVLSHPEDCQCVIACLPLRRDAEARKVTT